MFKCFFLIVFSLAVLFVINSNEPLVKRSFSQTMPSATPPEQNETGRLVLDKDEVCRPCPPGNRPTAASGCGIEINVTVLVSKAENKNLDYEYTVSGGRVTGKGSKVIWDMNGAEPGTYQIRVDVRDEAKAQLLSETKTIKVVDYICCLPICVCPNISVNAPALPTKASETMTFAADVRGGVDSITYSWTVSDGEIIEGQGTPFIKVVTNSKMAGKTVRATVEIGGICEECEKNASADGLVAGKKFVGK